MWDGTEARNKKNMYAFRTFAVGTHAEVFAECGTAAVEMLYQ